MRTTNDSQVDAGTATAADSDEAAAAIALSPQTSIERVIDNPLLEDYGRFLFPITYRVPEGGDTLADVADLLPWYHYVSVDDTIDVIGDVLSRRQAEQTVFHSIYSTDEQDENPDLVDTGLFHFPAQGVSEGERAPFAILCAGGGFAYVGSIHDSMPHALWLSRHGVHAFTLQYRLGAQVASEDLARAVSYVVAHADELGVDASGYSLWGGSAGARVAAYVGSYGPAAFGGDDLPQPTAVVMQYTGHTDTSGHDPATYGCVGTSDGIANWRAMQSRIETVAAEGVPTELHVFDSLPHGFGLGRGTVAEGWIQGAFDFWEAQR